MPAVNDYWSLVLEALRQKLSKSNFEAWFTSLGFVKTTNNGRKLILSTSSSFSKNYIETKFKHILKEAVSKYYPQVVHIDFEISNTVAETTGLQQEGFFPLQSELSDLQEKIKEVKSKTINLNQGSIIPKKNIHNLNPKYTLENFVVTGNNELAVSVAKAIIEKPGVQYNPVFLYSGVGLGKTHLLQAIGQKILENKPDSRIRYTTCEAFFNLFISGIQNKKSAEFKDYYRNTDVLLIDDIQFIAGKEATQEAFFHAFNELHQNNKQIVITSDKHPKSLGAVEERLISRFEWGIVIDISKPELEDRIRVLKDKVERLRLPLTLDQLTRIATAVDTNYRDLEGVLNRIEARIKLLPEKPFEDYELNKILGGFHQAIPMNIQIKFMPNSSDRIMDAVCKVFDITKSELLGKNRQQHIALARQVAMYLCKNELDLSFPAVGKIFGRDHTTVLHACRRLHDDMAIKSKISSKVEAVKSMLQEAFAQV